MNDLTNFIKEEDETMNPTTKINLSDKSRFTPENGESTEINISGGWLKQGFDCEASTAKQEHMKNI